MELANSFNQANLLHATSGLSYSTPQPFNIYPGFRRKSLHQRILNYGGLASRACPTRRLKQTIGCSGIISRGKVNCALWYYGTYRPTVCYPGSLSKASKELASQCQGNDSVAFVDGSNRDVDIIEGVGDESSRTDANFTTEPSSPKEGSGGEEGEVPTLEELRELLQKALNDLEAARVNSTMFEGQAQKISEAAIALKDEAESAQGDVNNALNSIQETITEETVAKEAILKATTALSLAEAKLQVAVDSLRAAKERNGPQETSIDNLSDESGREELNTCEKEEEALLAAQEDIRECQDNLKNCEAELKRLQDKKEELQKEVDRLNVVAEQAQLNALKAEEDVAKIMLLAEQAVAFELEAAQRVNDAEIALQRAEKNLATSPVDIPDAMVPQNGSSSQDLLLADEAVVEEVSEGTIDSIGEQGKEMAIAGSAVVTETLQDAQFNTYSQRSEEVNSSDESDDDNVMRDIEADVDKSKSALLKKQEVQWESTKDSSAVNAPKTLLKKSSRFFSASFFSFAADEEFTPASVFHGLLEFARKQFPKLVVGSLLVAAG